MSLLVEYSIMEGKADEQTDALNEFVAGLASLGDDGFDYTAYETDDPTRFIAVLDLDEEAEDSDLLYRMVVYQITAGRYKEAFTYLENALILDFENHEVLFEFFPKLETQKALFKIIDQYRKTD